jgi:hypothetical protein
MIASEEFRYNACSAPNVRGIAPANAKKDLTYKIVVS